MPSDARRKPRKIARKATCDLALYAIFRALALLVSVLCFVACFSTRPVIKIGLIAPFEGLYRRTGYDALSAMRAAIADTPTTTVDILPLALDDANEPLRARRAAQKLLVDPSVQAVVGPLTPATFSNIKDLLPAIRPVWVAPFAVAPATDNFADSSAADAWATKLIGAVANVAQAQRAQRLIVVGWPSGWPQPSAQIWKTVTALPVTLTGDEIDPVAQGDAVLWLGSPDGAALYLAKLRAKFPTAPFWLGPQGGDPVFVERSKRNGPVYWATWIGADYTKWAAQHTPATPAAYLVYQATRQAIAAATDQALPMIVGGWHVEFFMIGADGKSQPYAKAHS